MSATVDCGGGKTSTVGRELEMGARLGDEKSIALLNGPEPPPSVAYLLEWADALGQYRTMGQHGWHRVAPESVESWARQRDLTLLPHEVDALATLDALLLYPDTGDDDDEE